MKIYESSAGLSIVIRDLTNCFEHFNKLFWTFESIDKIKDNQELINLLTQIQKSMVQF